MQGLMTDLTYWLLAVPQQSFFSAFMEDMKAHFAEHDYWAIISDPRVAIALGVIFVISIVLKTKTVPLMIFAIYGYTLTFHLAGSMRAKGEAGQDFIGNLDSVAVFLLGFMVTTGVIVYFTLIKQD